MIFPRRSPRQNRFIPLDDSRASPSITSVAARYMLVLIIGILIGLPIVPLVKYSESEILPATDCSKCHKVTRKDKFTEYFKKSGNKYPEKMAEAVLATEQPRLLAAVAVAGEKNTPYTVRNGGYKKRHAGAWQVNPKHWGKVPKDPVGQARQAEKIFLELTEEKSITLALSIYGGDSSSKYSDRVIKELCNVPS